MNVHLQRAVLLLEQGRADLAEPALRQALAAEPDNPVAHAMLALVLTRAERLAEATDAARAAVRLAPDLSLTHYALANVLHDRQRLDEAAAAAGEAIRLDPADADGHGLLGQIRFDQRRWGEALAAADAGLRLDPRHVGCLNVRAAALVQLGRRDEAAATIEGALARQPDNAITHANQGWALLHGGDHRRALEHFREALRLDPQLDWARRGLVEALKARYPFYGLLLRYFLWMSGLSARAQWAILIGAFLLTRLPGLRLLLPVYLLFALLTWTADPLFTLLLRLNRFGRLVLSREEVTASNAVGGCLLLALIVAAGALAAASDPLLLVALATAGLVVPVAAVFQCQPGWPRAAMTAYTALVALAVFASAALAIAGPADAYLGTLGLAAIGIFLGSWLGNALAMVRPKR